jgi:hypothetical protein
MPNKTPTDVVELLAPAFLQLRALHRPKSKPKKGFVETLAQTLALRLETIHTRLPGLEKAQSPKEEELYQEMESLFLKATKGNPKLAQNTIALIKNPALPTPT